ncbi:MAG: hypothetical protein WAV28_07880, partial [Sedimentisphaerales bacterium]
LFEDSGPGRKVAVFNQNRWPLSIRISGHFESESLAGFDQNMHIQPAQTNLNIANTNWRVE